MWRQESRGAVQTVDGTSPVCTESDSNPPMINSVNSPQEGLSCRGPDFHTILNSTDEQRIEQSNQGLRISPPCVPSKDSEDINGWGGRTLNLLQMRCPSQLGIQDDTKEPYRIDIRYGSGSQEYLWSLVWMS